MSDFTAAFSVTIPAGTAINSPLLTQTPLGWADVEEIDVVVPAGCAGNVGFQLWLGGTTSYPVQTNGWFVFDDFVYTQEVSNQVDSGQWAVNAYNVDTFPHTLRFYFKGNYPSLPPSVGSSTLVSV